MIISGNDHKINKLFMDNKRITVTSPLLPNLDEFHKMLEDIWERKWITNNGYYHKQLEQALAEYLKVSSARASQILGQLAETKCVIKTDKRSYVFEDLLSKTND